jgi:luciferase family oxidoreductase group 1
MIAHLAAVTQRLRLGSGGVMLPNHSPLVIAEEFSMLQGLYPGRIDLGIGRARGADPATVPALRREPATGEEFISQLDELAGFLGGGFPPGHRYEKVRIALKVEPPPLYLLGSSESSACLAASLGLPFAFAHHLNPKATSSSLCAYRARFRDGGTRKKPYTIATVSIVCASSQEEADRAALRAAIIRIRRGIALQHNMDVSDDVLLYPSWSDEERRVAEKELAGGWILVGGPEQVMTDLTNLHRATGADELMLTTFEYDGPSRIRTLQTVADACRLSDTLIV